jgi:hypothetical protein
LFRVRKAVSNESSNTHHPNHKHRSQDPTDHGWRKKDERPYYAEHGHTVGSGARIVTYAYTTFEVMTYALLRRAVLHSLHCYVILERSNDSFCQRILTLANVFWFSSFSETQSPVPRLKTRGGHGMFYMRPIRYVPGETPTKVIVDNLVYAMNSMVETEHNSRRHCSCCCCSWLLL